MVGTQAGTEDQLSGARAALARAEWDEARELFRRAAETGDAPEAWEGLSRAAWWLGDEQTTLSARERAYRRYQAAGDVRRAAHMATWLAGDHLDFHGDDAVGRAWLRRGGSLLEGHDLCAEHGWLLVMEADIVLSAEADPRATERLAREGLAVARQVGDVDVEVVALALLGTALITAGDVDEGLECVGESTALAVGGEFGDAAAPGWALCHNVAVCAGLGDFGQAEQWCRAMQQFASTWRARHFFGTCRLAYGDVLAAHGDWTSAEEELVSAREDLRSTKPGLAGPSAVRLGELRARQGRLDEARALFEEALPSAAAVLALAGLDLQAGDAEAATAAAERVLRRTSTDNLFDRLPALELLARGRCARGDHAGALAAATEVERESARLGTPYLCGRALAVRAEVALAAAEPEDACRAAEDAIDHFAEASAPFELARARLTLSQALRRLGRAERADLEEGAAREALDLLGAPSTGQVSHEELSTRELDILRLVAAGLSDARIAERLFLSPHTVHRHVANVRTKLGVASRAAAVADATRRGLL